MVRVMRSALRIELLPFYCVISMEQAVGYGNVEKCESKGKAFQKAKKDAVADGLKRALRYFEGVRGKTKYVLMAPRQNESKEDRDAQCSDHCRQATNKRKRKASTLRNGECAPKPRSKSIVGHEEEPAGDEFGSDPLEETDLVEKMQASPTLRMCCHIEAKNDEI